MYTLDANIFAVSLDREQRERAALVVRALTPAEALAELEGDSGPGGASGV
jgi:hypothetical protein